MNDKSGTTGIRDYNYHTWSKFMVRQPKDRPRGEHYGAVLFETRKEYTPPYDQHDSGDYTDTPEVHYFAFTEKRDLETWAAEAAQTKKHFFCFYVPCLAQVDVKVVVDLGLPPIRRKDNAMPQTAIQGVVGLAFSRDMSSLLLIRKRKPASQAGKLNGVGGKVEPGESPIDAMVREFREETGLQTTPTDWERFAVLHSPDWEVTFFRGRFDDAFLQDAVHVAVPLTDERVEYWDVQALRDQNTMRNLRWLVPFCLDTSRYVLPLQFNEH